MTDSAPRPPRQDPATRVSLELIGLPGSGKTRLARRLAQELAEKDLLGTKRHQPLKVQGTVHDFGTDRGGGHRSSDESREHTLKSKHADQVHLGPGPGESSLVVVADHATRHEQEQINRGQIKEAAPTIFHAEGADHERVVPEIQFHITRFDGRRFSCKYLPNYPF